LKKIEPIAIIGMRCAGKTTVGRALATRLGTGFIDTDEVVAQRLGADIIDLFAQGRESEFREAEQAVCIEALGAGCVLALGGGAVTSERVRRALWSVTTIFLDASDQLITSRLQVDSRPSITGLAPAVEAAELSRMRRPWYLDVADFVIHVDGRTVDEVCDEIVGCLQGFDSGES